MPDPPRRGHAAPAPLPGLPVPPLPPPGHSSRASVRIREGATRVADDGDTAGAYWEANGRAGVGRCGVSTTCRDGPCRSTHSSERSMVPGHGNRCGFSKTLFPTFLPQVAKRTQRVPRQFPAFSGRARPTQGFRGRGRRRTTDTRGSTVLPPGEREGHGPGRLPVCAPSFRVPWAPPGHATWPEHRDGCTGQGRPVQGKKDGKTRPHHPLPGPPCPDPSRRP